ncbi:hypothetical protein DPQ33_12435 [Oceanidesulfovibrio indonesiensis]|uniref:DNA-3-methyladenine glycosylase 2 family protein n=1 Tax=Oceanidesulfovibrio indonesiensis TaxID=54767 RepID=A0A7M3MD30_9BACT|nr:hypothetical protein [Oceanidesulfovibrio indonesiensis]TVM16420.1 hypothetical protein DPQ33_12435 [Oceanidesulfovibrio indonesiensis]
MPDATTHRLTTNGVYSWEQVLHLIRARDSITARPIAGDALALPLLLDGCFTPVGVHLSWTADENEEGKDGVVVHCEGVDDETARRAAHQVAQIFSLDVTAPEAEAFEDVLERDGVLAALHDRRAGLRPVLFATVYEACVWSILTARSSMRQARSLWRDYAEAHGLPVQIAGRTHTTFPPPSFFLEGNDLPGIRRQKRAYLEDVARAALAGHLNRDRLRAMPLEQTRKELRKVKGIGPFFADMVSAFGVGRRDVFMEHEPRIHEAMARRYGVEASDMGALRQIAEGWRPFRTWGCFLLFMDALLGG